jgi:uncharacterized protein
MNRAILQFDRELNAFLTPGRRGREIAYEFEGTPAVKHLIEALRVPHTEVGQIIVNGRQEGFAYQVQDGDQVEVYPSLLEERDGAEEGVSAEELHFLLDNHLGKLATFLRILGLDAAYRNDYQDDELAQVASQEGRILLTRDRGLLMRKVITQGYCVRALDPRQQIVEIVQRFDLYGHIQPFRRCLRCNSLLQAVDKQAIIERLEPLTRQYYDEFHICPQCDKIYWKGSHYEHMEKFLEGITMR